ncbi:MAG TPA: M23 family metallopeptidase [Anaerolineales bacterium]|nr:M23 family metallopeptidase [Anaerolineales bacterium]
MAIQLIAPVNGPITQLFGVDPEFYKRFGFPGHNGIDYGISNGTSIRAAAAGTVDKVTFENGGYGNYVRLSHLDGSRKYFTYYAHLASAAVSPGQTVQAGTAIGFSNNTGASTGPHLHFGLRIDGENPAYKGYVDPMPFFTAGDTGSTGTSSTDVLPDAVELPDLQLEVTFETLNVRIGPGIEYSIVGQLTKGTKINGRRLHSKSVWVEFEPGRWCAMAFDGTAFLKLGE